MVSLSDLFAQHPELYVLMAFSVAANIFLAVAYWKVFQKAGKPGWVSLIPIYNVVVMIQMAKRPDWWILLMFIPLANLYGIVKIHLDIARQFGKSDGLGFGLLLLPIVFIPILAFGNARYMDEDERVNQLV